MDKFVIALDVGGTTVKAGLVDPGLKLIDEIDSYPSHSGQDAETILENLVYIIREQWEKSYEKKGSIRGISVGFPGPFDYENGISLIKGIGKYDSIFGRDIGAEIKLRLTTRKLIRTSGDIDILFENDAVVFALGEYNIYRDEGYERMMCLTLGTGCGSSFIYKGVIVRGDYGVPESGYIFDQPFLDGIVDDFISRRGILKTAENKGFDTRYLDVREIDEMARGGNKKALEVFSEFGIRLGKVLNLYASRFKPDIIVLGGKISFGIDLFRKDMNEQMTDYFVDVKASKNLSKSALTGAASLFGNGGIV